MTHLNLKMEQKIMTKINEEDIKKFYSFFKHSKSIEIRVFDKIKYPDGKSIFVNDENMFLNEIINYQNENVDVYIGGRDRIGTTDNSVISSDFIFIESDDSDETEKIIELLKKHNIKIALAGISGQGLHAYIPHTKILFENNEQGEKYKKEILDKFCLFLKHNNLNIDTRVFNLSRVSRVLGSYNFKRNKLSNIFIFDENIDIKENTKNVEKILNTIQNTSSDSKCNQTPIELLEKYKIQDDHAWLYDLIKNKVNIKPNTGRNDIVMKYTAMICVLYKISKTEREIIAKTIIEDCGCSDSSLTTFEGWIKQLTEKYKLYDNYKNHINNFIRLNEYALTPYNLNKEEKEDNKKFIITKLMTDIKNDNDEEKIEQILFLLKNTKRLFQEKILDELNKKTNINITVLKRSLKNLKYLDNPQTEIDIATETNKIITFFIDKLHLANQFIKIQPIYYERKGLFWVWDNTKYCWVNKDETDILNLISERSVANTISSKDKNEILEALKQVGRKNKPRDIKPTWIQFKNKIYDIENENIIEATPEYFVANPIDRKIGDSEETPIIDKLMSEWVGSKNIDKLFEIIAFVLVPKYFIHSFFFLYSPPGMGKSTFRNLIIKFIGEHNCAATTIDRINKNTRFETCNWQKKLLITLSEVNKINDLTNTSIINNATGDDPIPAEIKGGESFEFNNYGKFIYPTNKLLKVDAEDGFGRRVRTIKFINRFEKERDVLDEIPEYEFENLAKKCLKIAKRLWETRKFTGDVNISERMKMYQEISKTSLELFINQYCDMGDFNAKTLFDEFYAKYINITQKDDSKIKVSKELRALGFEINLENWKEDHVQHTLKHDNISGHQDNTVIWKSGRRISGISLK